MELLAERVLRRHRLTAPPVNVDEVANGEGLDFGIERLESVYGSYVRDEDQRGHAYIAADQHRVKQRFTKAHELAHHLVDEETALYAEGGVIRLPTGYRGRDRHWAHDRFAAALLMPRGWVGAFMRDQGWRYERDVLIQRVARTFDVSRPAAEIRLVELGHIERRA